MQSNHTYAGIREISPADIEEYASLDLGRRLGWACKCFTIISRKIIKTKNGIHYKHYRSQKLADTWIQQII